LIDRSMCLFYRLLGGHVGYLQMGCEAFSGAVLRSGTSPPEYRYRRTIPKRPVAYYVVVKGATRGKKTHPARRNAALLGSVEKPTGPCRRWQKWLQTRTGTGFRRAARSSLQRACELQLHPVTNP